MNDIYMRFPGGRIKALTLSYDDGVTHDIRLAALMDKYGVKGTFNINGGLFSSEEQSSHWRLTKKEAIELFKESAHEVAVHTLTHPHLELLPPAAVAQQILGDRMILEEMFKKPIRGMAYPFGTYNDTVLKVLASTGIVYSRTVKSTRRFDIPTNWLELPATCHHNDSALSELTERFLRETPNNPYLFYLWGHSYEFDNDNNWYVMEQFLSHAGGRSEIWYATNIEIYDYITAYSRLEFSADMSIVKNPSAATVFFQSGKNGYEIPAGAVLIL